MYQASSEVWQESRLFDGYLNSTPNFTTLHYWFDSGCVSLECRAPDEEMTGDEKLFVSGLLQTEVGLSRGAAWQTVTATKWTN